MSDDFRQYFGDFEGRSWFNCSHQGPLPLIAAAETVEAMAWKLAPHRLTTERFTQTPRRLKRALAEMIGAAPDEVILANGASYGLHLLANGFPLRPGDEVLLMQGDFPSNLLPWLAHRKNGVEVRMLRPANHVLQVDEVAANLTAATRVLCTSWVHSFTGLMTDLEALGSLCRDRGVRFFVNVSQGLGARPLDVSKLPVDAIVGVGWKWLCGPYATGLCWMLPELRDTLRYNQSYWLSAQTADDLGRLDAEPALPEGLGARRYDVFGTANFFNFKPWTASVGLLNELGLERICAHNDRLAARLIDGLDAARYRVVRPPGIAAASIVVLSDAEADRNVELHRRLLDAGVDTAFRRGRIRFSIHLYNSETDVDRALQVLADGVRL